MTSRDGQLLNARIAKDGQWRFPPKNKVSEKFSICIQLFEDQYFNYHFGFNPVSIFRALKVNLEAQKVVQGGSTISQQVIRLSRKQKQRNLLEKIRELILAIRLECGYSKSDILELYAAHAPFGGNVVGLEAASWRYFNRHPDQLSWAESATLAVLPNAPSLIFPGKNTALLLKKRNKLLKKCLDNQYIDSVSYQLALLEELPKKPFPLPQLAEHFLNFLDKQSTQNQHHSSIDIALQARVQRLVDLQHKQFSEKEIHNAAVLVLDVETRQVLCYIGNTKTSRNHQVFVDNIQAPRSSGSVLKPFLYASMLTEGSLLPKAFIQDIPTQFSNFKPKNFNHDFEGLVPADEALSRSLNIPAVRALKQYAYPRFHQKLNSLGFKHINKEADHYGLSLILGGSECSLWEITGRFAGLASILNTFDKHQAYAKNAFESPKVLASDSLTLNLKTGDEFDEFSVAAVYETFKALKQVKRPWGEQAWRYFSHAQDIAWKTGTSFGYRDAWAVGSTSRYTVGVWMGNSDGEGRPDLVGVRAAAPLMFQVFETLEYRPWPAQAISEYERLDLCSKTGLLAQSACPKTTTLVPKQNGQSKTCPYHRFVFLDEQENAQVNTSCYPASKIKKIAWFVLPAIEAHFYRKKHKDYKALPPFLPGCQTNTSSGIALIYPEHNTTIYLPKTKTGQQTKVVLEATHTDKSQHLFWFLDEEFIGETSDFHTMTCSPKPGKHKLMLMSTSGETTRMTFWVKH